MIKSRLVIGGTSVGFIDLLAISSNYAVADVRDPDKRDAAHTKSITVPGTADSNQIFEYAFEANIDLQTFNPNLKIEAIYYVNEIEVFRGDLQLQQINVYYHESIRSVNYICNIIGTQGNFFLDIANLLLTDLADPVKGYEIPGSSPPAYGFTDLNHVLSYANFSATPVPGTGYCYGYIDYGLGGLNGYNWDVEAMKAAIWELEYVRRIFAARGKRFTSGFLNSAYYKKIAIPDVNEGGYQLSQAQKDNNQFYANKTSTQSVSMTTLMSSVPNAYVFPTGPQNVTAVFQDETTPPFNDAGGIYNNATGVMTTTQITQNSVIFTLNFSFLFASLPAGAVSYETVTADISIGIRRNGVLVANPLLSLGAGITGTISAGSAILSGNMSVTYTSPVKDPVGTTYQCVFTGATTNIYFKDGSGTPVVSGSPTASFRLDNNSTFFNRLASTNLVFGNTVDMNSTIPTGIKQLDFLTSIFFAHNLYVEQDKSDLDNFVIEPRDDGFYLPYNGDDWTDKQDTSEVIEILPMGHLDAKRFKFAYKSDKDYFNEIYEKKYKEVYGSQLVEIENDFIKGEKVVELIFSATPSANFQTDIVAPRLLTIDGAYPGTGASGTVKTLKCNIRRLYWGGMKNCQLHNLRASAGAYAPAGANYIHPVQYPSLNHMDDAVNPTVDLNFMSPYEFYWVVPGQMWTNNNLYNAFYDKFITEITDPNSKIVKTYILLTETDINQFSFRKIIFINGTYYVVNKISNFDPQQRTSCLVELLKLKKGITFSGNVPYNPNNPPPNQNASRAIAPSFNYLGNEGMSGNLVVGQALFHGGSNGILTGHDARIEIGVVDFDGIGISNMNIDYNYNGRFVARNGAFVVSDAGVETLKPKRIVYTTNFDVVPSIPVYFVDASSADITIIMPIVVNEDCEYTIVRLDNSSNLVTLRGFDGAELFNQGTTSGITADLPARTTFRLFTDHTDWYY